MARDFNNVSIADLEAGNKALTRCPLHMVSPENPSTGIASSPRADVMLAWQNEFVMEQAGMRGNTPNYSAQGFTGVTLADNISKDPSRGV